MSKLNTLQLSYRFAILIAVFVLGFAVYGGWSFKTLNDLKVNGPVYQRIVQGKDLVADILPPPEYILESYLVTLQLAGEGDKAEQNKLIVKLQALKADYDSRHEYWSEKKLGSDLEDAFIKQAHEPALAFYGIAFDSLIPAVQRNDRDAIGASMSRMKSAYETHRKAIDQVVQITGKRTVTDEYMAKEHISEANIFLMMVLGISMIVGIGIATLIVRSLMKNLGAEPYELSATSSRIAEGNLDFHVSLSENDQSSVMYQMDKMREQLKERIELERKKTEADLRIERAEREKQVAEQQTLREKEKLEIYLSMTQAAHHILNNLLNQLQLFKLEAEKSKDFDKEILQLFDGVANEASDLIHKLSNVSQLTKESIKESVVPK
jgi:methyl-accepting chemotaxis protein